MKVRSREILDAERWDGVPSWILGVHADGSVSLVDGSIVWAEPGDWIVYTTSADGSPSVSAAVKPSEFAERYEVIGGAS